MTDLLCARRVTGPGPGFCNRHENSDFIINLTIVQRSFQMILNGFFEKIICISAEGIQAEATIRSHLMWDLIEAPTCFAFYKYTATVHFIYYKFVKGFSTITFILLVIFS